MWVYKTAKELKKTQKKKRFSLSSALGYAALTFIIFSSFYLVGYRNWKEDYEQLTWSEYLWIAPGILIVSILVGLYIFLTQIFSITGKELGGTVVCMKCEEVFSIDNPKKCDCGNGFVPIEKLKWVN